ncbi:MAG: threonine--tRNA ligase [Acholeplasmatales bacterium]|jgi:threonyl-tRNA synthetase|nr:threonine--tRNA ligase [Acholeplasmatales bacterium]
MINFKENEQLNMLNHSCAHVLAQAVKRLFPNAKFWVGPVIDTGFYYDIDLQDYSIKEEDLEKIESQMKKISKEAKYITRIELTKAQALELFSEDNYKLDLINNLPENEIISAYKQGEFIDLCRGPHVSSTKEIKYFKLIKFSGAYYKGDSSLQVLQRIYGVCFPTEEELNEYLQNLEEAKLRDHRKIGKDLNLFMTHELVGSGFPLFLPAGANIRNKLERYIKDKEEKLGYLHVYTPSIATVNLYKTSGHWDHYKDNMFPVMKMDNEELVLRPMNCPHHMLIYKNSLHSYRDLPLRIGELAHDFRYEASGAVAGIERVRQMCQNDAHLFVRPDQIKEEFKNVVKLILEVYKDFNIKDYEFRLSLRDELDKEKYFPDDTMWNNAESELREVLNEIKSEFNINYFEAKGEAAFYGPKLDVQVKTAIGHELTVSTCQLDFLLPQRFDLTYVDQFNTKVRPVVLHRAILGSFERFMAFIIEEYKGAFPLWLSPNQISIVPVHTSSHLKYALKVKEKLTALNLSVNLDDRNEKFNYRLRDSQITKTPITLVIGDAEVASKTLNIREYGSLETKIMPLNEFLKYVKKRIDEKR